MLPNEIFALACRAYYDEQGLIVDKRNGEFAHCPLTRKECDTGYYLLWEHHQQQGLLQSEDLGKCCFFPGDAKKWLRECNYWPENYFDLWDIYEKYMCLHNAEVNARVHAEKDENGKSKHAVKLGKIAHEEKDERGKSKHAVEMVKKVHEKRDEFGRSIQAVKNSEKLHAEKDSLGRSINSVKGAKIASEKVHREKDERGKSKHAVKTGHKGGIKTHENRNEEGKSIRALQHNRKLHSQKNEEGKSEHAVRTGRATAEKLGKRIEVVNTSSQEIFRFNSLKEAAKTLQISSSGLSAVCLGKYPSIKGHTARYL